MLQTRKYAARISISFGVDIQCQFRGQRHDIAPQSPFIVVWLAEPVAATAIDRNVYRCWCAMSDDEQGLAVCYLQRSALIDTQCNDFRLPCATIAFVEL